MKLKLSTFALALLTGLSSGTAWAGFFYTPISDGILSASFNADFAALTAHRTIAGEQVNKLILTALDGTVLDLSDGFYGNSELLLGDTPKIDQGPLDTGIFSVAIPTSFFPALQAGEVGLLFLATDTNDGLFAIDYLSLEINTTAGTVESFIDTNDGFKIGIPDGGSLPSPLPFSIAAGATGTGFDEAISSKLHENKLPEPGSGALLGIGLLAGLLQRRKAWHLRLPSWRRLAAAGGALLAVFPLSGNVEAVEVVPGPAINLSQVDFAFEFVQQQDSDWGRLEISTADLVSATGLSSGYLNVMTDGGWVVQNFPVDASDGIDMQAIYFGLDLTPPSDVTTLSAHIEFTADPIIDFVDGTRSTFPVGAVSWDAEGVGESPAVGVPAAPLKKNPVKFTPDGPMAKEKTEHDANVQTAHNQCAPMSVANSLEYLRRRYKIQLPFDHVPGIRGPGDNKQAEDTLVGQLDRCMDRRGIAVNEKDIAKRRRTGSGVPIPRILDGKFCCMKKFGLKDVIVNKHQGRGFGQNNTIPNGDYKSTGGPTCDATDKSTLSSRDDGAIVTGAWLCDQIDKGQDVELVYGSTSFEHAVRVFECGVTKGIRWIKFLHDREQTSVDPTDKKGLEIVYTPIEDLTGNGVLNILKSPQLKILFALSESPKLQPNQLHLNGPTPNKISTGAPGSITATVESNFVSAPDITVTFTKVLGNLVFTGGTISPDGRQATLQTNGDGLATMSFLGTSPGQALVKVGVTGMTGTAYSYFAVIP